jgi:MFS family permease
MTKKIEGSMGARLGKSFLGLKGNALVMSITEITGQGVLALTSTFWSLYVLDLGASIPILGLLGLIQGLFRVLIQIPAGYLTDKIGRKKLIVWGGFVSSFAPFTYFFATHWEHLIPGIMLEAFTNIVLPARQAMFADAVDPKRRATAFATFHTLLAIPSTVLPIIGGYLLERMGMLSGMRLALLISGIVMLLASLGRAIYLKESLIVEKKSAGKFSFKGTFLDMFEPVIRLRVLRIAIFGAFLYSLASGVVMRYSVVYATTVDFIGLSKTQWGIITGARGVVGMLTRIPTGGIIDRFSRKLCIFISYATRPIFTIAFALSKNFEQVLLIEIGGNIFSYFQQPALEALVIDVASTQRRGRAYGALNTIPGIASTIAPMIGAFFWEVFGPVWAFYISAFFTATAAVVLLAFLQEPEKREE